MTNILIVKTSSLGDILQCFPVIANLKRAFPDCTIDWVAERGGAPLLEAHPMIRKVLKIDSKGWRNSLFSKSTRSQVKAFVHELQSEHYDFLFDLQANFKSSWVTWKAKANRKVGYGRKTVREWPNLLVTNEKYDPPTGANRRLDYLGLIERVFGIIPLLDEKIELTLSPEEESTLWSLPLQSKPILVSPGSMWKNKTLPVTTLLSFLKEVQKKENCPFLFSWGSPQEKADATILAEKIEGTLLPKLSLPLLQRVMGKCRLVISPDSLPLHLAATAGISTFSYFGPSQSSVFRPIGTLHRSIQGSCPYGETFDQRCRHLRSCKEAPCINQMDPQSLHSAFNKEL